MLKRNGTLLYLLGGLTGCGACSESESVVDPAARGQGSEVVIGDEVYAEELVRAWFEMVESGDTDALDFLVLSAEQADQIFDCSQADDPESRGAQAIELRDRLSTEVEAVHAELQESGAHYEFQVARVPLTKGLALGSESEGCVLLQDIRRHKVRSVMKRVDSLGEVTQEQRLTAVLEVDGSWFMAGVPGPLVPEVSAPARVGPRKMEPIGPLMRSREPVRIQPPTTVEPGTP